VVVEDGVVTQLEVFGLDHIGLGLEEVLDHLRPLVLHLRRLLQDGHRANVGVLRVSNAAFRAHRAQGQSTLRLAAVPLRGQLELGLGLGETSAEAVFLLLVRLH